MNRARNARGNMLFLVVLTIGLIIGTGLMGFGFNRFLSHRTRAQSSIDSEALSFANIINEGNRVGQINDMEQCSRELIYLSRERYEKCQQEEDSAFLAPLCYQLLNEARDGHMLLEQERRNQIQQICSEIQQAATQYNLRAGSKAVFDFSWPSTGQPQVSSVSLGSIDKICSNVKNREVIKELSDFDRSMGYVDPSTGLYRAEINAKLPNEGDLNFYFSGLPANVEGTCSPARNANPDVFVVQKTIFRDGQAADQSLTHLPNAVQLFGRLEASAGENANANVNLVSTAVSNGDSTQAK